jgi:hypothetical protein
MLQSHFEVSAIERKPGRDKALVRFNVKLSNDRGETVLEGFHVYLLRTRGGPAKVESAHAV